MANIIPFRAIRPAKDKVHMVVSRSIAVYSRRILNAKLETNPYSFLHVIKPDHFDKKKAKSTRLFKKVREKLEEFCNEKILVKDDNESFYVYRQIKPEGTYTGVIAGVSIDDYINGEIKVHEQTITKREKIFEKYLRICDFNAEPVLLTYPDQTRVDKVVEVTTEKEPLFDYSTPDRLRHQLWRVDDYHNITELIESFADIDSVYIADGHHRSASSALLGKHKRKENPNFTGKEGFNYLLAYFIPESQLAIYDYNRLVKDLNKLSVDEFLLQVSEYFLVEKQSSIFKPSCRHEFGMYLENEWYKLTLKPREVDESNPVERLDSSILTHYILTPILGISDLKTNTRIGFLGGLKGMKGLQNEVDKQKAKVAFALYPVGVEQLKKIADTNNIMPPKTTWIEPKLRSGLTVFEL
ncbi:MAG: DUF1015 domain-containing protein [Flavobacteriales bacterium]|nr:DUF1015 domain-containing protein [Flavobacteriales bacterium]